jgi:GNAT superfamily N-acetyltransferase
MNDDVDLSIRQMCGAWKLMCAVSPRYTEASDRGIAYIFSGLPLAFFNVAMVTQDRVSAEALQAYGREACDWAAPHGVPWLFIVTQDALKAGVDAMAELDACGLAPMMPLTGMRAQQVEQTPRVPSDLDLQVPENDADCGAILDINSAAYGMDLDAGRSTLGTRAFWKNHFPVLGLADGKPVSSATVLMVDGHRYVALVATDPGYQRRGYADAVLRRALELSAEAHGEHPTVLHASDAGRPVYERMGYTPIASHMIFMEKKFLGDH